jgi:flagellar motor switch protein FliM
MSKTFKQQPKQPKPMREATQRYKRERRKEQDQRVEVRARMALGEGRLTLGHHVPNMLTGNALPVSTPQNPIRTSVHAFRVLSTYVGQSNPAPLLGRPL